MGGDRRLQRGRHLYLDDAGAADVSPALALDRAALGKLADDLLRKEGVTGSAPGDSATTRSTEGSVPTSSLSNAEVSELLSGLTAMACPLGTWESAPQYSGR